MLLRFRALDLNLPVETVRTFVRYCCRLVGAQEIRDLTAGFPATTTEQVRDVRRWVDGQLRNQLYECCWELVRQDGWLQNDWRPKLPRLAAQYGIDPDDLAHYYGCLSQQDRQEIGIRSKPTTFVDQEIVAIVQSKQIVAYCKKLAWFRLRFIYQNDRAMHYEDAVADLQVQAVEVLRYYEPLGLSHQHLVNNVYAGLRNYCVNFARHYGSAKRNPLVRIQTVSTRSGWYCCGAAVYLVEIPRDPVSGRSAVVFPNGQTLDVDVMQLYSTRQEALDAMQNPEHRRPAAIDLSRDRHEWCSACVSLWTTDMPLRKSLLNFMTDRRAPDDLWNEMIDRCRDPAVRKAVEQILNPSPLFDFYCQQHYGRSSRDLGETTIRKAARRYCRLDRKKAAALQQKYRCTAV